MKVFATVIGVLAATALAAPAFELEARQTVGATANEFTRFGCRNILFFFARGSTEPGNLGTVVGPQVGSLLKASFGGTNVGVEGIDYAALLITNFNPGGADYAGIAEMKDLLNSASSKCPNAKIVVGGYSQGAALCHRAIENLSQTVKNRINGVVTFGDTQNLQDRGQIPNFPREKVKIFCNPGDLVCAGTLTITAAHLSYGSSAPAAADFLAGRIRAS